MIIQKVFDLFDFITVYIGWSRCVK